MDEKQENLISDQNSSESNDSAFYEDFYNKYSLEQSNDLKPISAVSSIFNRKYTVQIEEEYL